MHCVTGAAAHNMYNYQSVKDKCDAHGVPCQAVDVDKHRDKPRRAQQVVLANVMKVPPLPCASRENNVRVAIFLRRGVPDPQIPGACGMHMVLVKASGSTEGAWSTSKGRVTWLGEMHVTRSFERCHSHCATVCRICCVPQRGTRGPSSRKPQCHTFQVVTVCMTPPSPLREFPIGPPLLALFQRPCPVLQTQRILCAFVL